MKWIGLTGGIASGKSTVTKALRSLGYAVIDADEVAHEVVDMGSSGLKSVVQEFGPEILNLDGSLDRRKLGLKVFGNSVQIEKLENILHPLIKDRVEQLRSQLRSHSDSETIAFYDVPLLFEKGMEAEFDQVVVVTCTQEQQLERLRLRNNLSENEVQARLNSQLPLKIKEQQANFVLHNDEGSEKLDREIKRLISFLLD